MISEEIEIINKLGLHARAANKLASLAGRFSSKIELQRNNQNVDAKSIISIMLLAAAKGTTLTVTCNGEDETEAMDAIRSLVNNRFDEAE
jgi:phosphocarrier protein